MLAFLFLPFLFLLLEDDNDAVVFEYLVLVVEREGEQRGKKVELVGFQPWVARELLCSTCVVGASETLS